MGIEEHLTIKGTVEGDPATAPPAVLEEIPLYNEFFTQPELYQRALIHLHGIKKKEGSSKAKGVHKDTFVVAQTFGDNTGSTEYFDIGKEKFVTVKHDGFPNFDVLGEVIYKKGEENTKGIKLSLYKGDEKKNAPFLEHEVMLSELPAIQEGMKKFVVDAGIGLEFSFSLKVNECTDKISSKEDLENFCTSNETIDYSEEVIEGESKEENAVLQCWCHKTSSKGAVLWFLGRNDCFMHPHVAKALFVGKGYDLYVLNYSCNGLCRQRGFLRSAHFNSHNRFGDFDLYIDQVEGAISIMKSKNSYDKVLGYAHSTGAPIFINYLIEKGDDFFDGFIFNAPFLDWAKVGSDFIEEGVETGVRFINYFKLASNDTKVQGLMETPKELKKTPINYINEEVVMSAYYAKRWNNYFYDFRARPLYAIPVTLGFMAGVTTVQGKVRKLKKKNSFVSTKPVLCIASRSDDTLDSDETLDLIDVMGSGRSEIELRLNTHDVFLSLDGKYNNMALSMAAAWMATQGFIEE